MGMYDTIRVKCPKCGTENDFQSKSGLCRLRYYTLEDCPNEAIEDVNRHAPIKCKKCGVFYEVDIESRQAVLSGGDKKGK